MFKLILNTKGGVTVIAENSDQIYLTNEAPANDAALQVSIRRLKSFKKVPARWHAENLLSAAADVCELKRGIMFLKKIWGQDVHIKDGHLRALKESIERLAEDQSQANIIKFAETINVINEKIKRRHS